MTVPTRRPGRDRGPCGTGQWTALGHEDLHGRRRHPPGGRPPRSMATRPVGGGTPRGRRAGCCPPQVVDERLHLAARQAHVAVHADAADAEQRRREREGQALVDAEYEQQQAEHAPRDRPRQPRPEPPASRRLRRRAPEVAFGRRLHWHVAPPKASPLARAVRIRSPTVPMDPAPRVITRSPGCARLATRPGRSARFGTT